MSFSHLLARAPFYSPAAYSSPRRSPANEAERRAYAPRPLINPYSTLSAPAFDSFVDGVSSKILGALTYDRERDGTQRRGYAEDEEYWMEMGGRPGEFLGRQQQEQEQAAEAEIMQDVEADADVNVDAEASVEQMEPHESEMEVAYPRDEELDALPYAAVQVSSAIPSARLDLQHDPDLYPDLNILQNDQFEPVLNDYADNTEPIERSMYPSLDGLQDAAVPPSTGFIPASDLLSEYTLADNDTEQTPEADISIQPGDVTYELGTLPELNGEADDMLPIDVLLGLARQDVKDVDRAIDEVEMADEEEQELDEQLLQELQKAQEDEDQDRQPELNELEEEVAEEDEVNEEDGEHSEEDEIVPQAGPSQQAHGQSQTRRSASKVESDVISIGSSSEDEATPPPVQRNQQARKTLPTAASTQPAPPPSQARLMSQRVMRQMDDEDREASGYASDDEEEEADGDADREDDVFGAEQAEQERSAASSDAEEDADTKEYKRMRRAATSRRAVEVKQDAEDAYFDGEEEEEGEEEGVPRRNAVGDDEDQDDEEDEESSSSAEPEYSQQSSQKRHRPTSTADEFVDELSDSELANDEAQAKRQKGDLHERVPIPAFMKRDEKTGEYDLNYSAGESVDEEEEEEEEEMEDEEGSERSEEEESGDETTNVQVDQNIGVDGDLPSLAGRAEQASDEASDAEMDELLRQEDEQAAVLQEQKDLADAQAGEEEDGSAVAVPADLSPLGVAAPEDVPSQSDSTQALEAVQSAIDLILADALSTDPLPTDMPVDAVFQEAIATLDAAASAPPPAEKELVEVLEQAMLKVKDIEEDLDEERREIAVKHEEQRQIRRDLLAEREQLDSAALAEPAVSSEPADVLSILASTETTIDTEVTTTATVQDSGPSAPGEISTGSAPAALDSDFAVRREPPIFLPPSLIIPSTFVDSAMSAMSPLPSAVSLFQPLETVASDLVSVGEPPAWVPIAEQEEVVLKEAQEETDDAAQIATIDELAEQQEADQMEPQAEPSPKVQMQVEDDDLPGEEIILSPVSPAMTAQEVELGQLVDEAALKEVSEPSKSPLEVEAAEQTAVHSAGEAEGDNNVPAVTPIVSESIAPTVQQEGNERETTVAEQEVVSVSEMDFKQSTEAEPKLGEQQAAEDHVPPAKAVHIVQEDIEERLQSSDAGVADVVEADDTAMAIDDLVQESASEPLVRQDAQLDLSEDLDSTDIPMETPVIDASYDIGSLLAPPVDTPDLDASFDIGALIAPPKAKARSPTPPSEPIHVLSSPSPPPMPAPPAPTLHNGTPTRTINAISPGLWDPSTPIRFGGQSLAAAVREAANDEDRLKHLRESIGMPEPQDAGSTTEDKAENADFIPLDAGSPEETAGEADETRSADAQILSPGLSLSATEATDAVQQDDYVDNVIAEAVSEESTTHPEPSLQVLDPTLKSRSATPINVEPPTPVESEAQAGPSSGIPSSPAEYTDRVPAYLLVSGDPGTASSTDDEDALVASLISPKAKTTRRKTRSTTPEPPKAHSSQEATEERGRSTRGSRKGKERALSPRAESTESDDDMDVKEVVASRSSASKPARERRENAAKTGEAARSTPTKASSPSSSKHQKRSSLSRTTVHVPERQEERSTTPGDDMEVAALLTPAPSKPRFHRHGRQESTSRTQSTSRRSNEPVPGSGVAAVHPEMDRHHSHHGHGSEQQANASPITTRSHCTYHKLSIPNSLAPAVETSSTDNNPNTPLRRMSTRLARATDPSTGQHFPQNYIFLVPGCVVFDRLDKMKEEGMINLGTANNEEKGSAIRLQRDEADDTLSVEGLPDAVLQSLIRVVGLEMFRDGDCEILAPILHTTSEGPVTERKRKRESDIGGGSTGGTPNKRANTVKR